MKNKKKGIDYTNQIIYVGIDVHKRSWSVSIIVGGIKIKTFSMNPEPKELTDHLRRNYPNGIYKTVYEAGFSGFWIDRELQKEGIINIVVNPADVPTSNKDKIRKTDKIDSMKLAKELSNDNLEGIYIPNKEKEAIRTLSRLRIQFTKDQTRMKNRIKSLLYFTGINFPENNEMKHWSGRFINHLENLEIEEASLKITLNKMIESLIQIRNQTANIVIELRKSLEHNKEAEETIRLLMTIPGVGFITAITLYTEIIDINRFSRLDQLSSFVGLAPGVYSSGEVEINTGLIKRNNSFLRNIIIESAWIAIRHDPALTMTYSRLKQRLISQKAIIRIAKKLLNRIMYVWRNQKPYTLAVVE